MKSPLMDRNTGEPKESSLSERTLSEKKKYRARGCRGGSKNKKRLDKITHPNTELFIVQGNLSSLDISLDEVDECHESTERFMETTISAPPSLNPPPGFAHNLEPYSHSDHIASMNHGTSSSITIAPSFNISTSPKQKQKLPSIAENPSMMTVRNIPQVTKSSSSCRSGTSESSHASVYDYYTKLMNDPNITFDSINKLNQGYSSTSISSSLSIRDTRMALEETFQNTNVNVSSSSLGHSLQSNVNEFTTTNHVDASPVHVFHTSSSHHLVSAYNTPPCPSTPNKYNLSSNLFSTYDGSDDERLFQGDKDSSFYGTTQRDKRFEPSRQQLFPPSICDTSASSSSLSSRLTPSIHDPMISYNYDNSSGSSLLSYPLLDAVDQHDRTPVTMNNMPPHPPSDSTLFSSSLYSSFDQDFLPTDSEQTPLPLYVASFVQSSHHQNLSSYSDTIPRKITTTQSSATKSKTADDVYTQCLQQTRSNLLNTDRRRIHTSWSIESDDRSHVKPIGQKRLPKVEPTKVPLRLSSLPPIVSNSYSTLRDNHYGNQEPSVATTHSSIASRSNQYTGALETFYRSFLPSHSPSDLLCNNHTSMRSEPKEDTSTEESFFNLSPDLFLLGITKKENR